MKTERTFIAIKPDGVQRGIIGKIVERFENKGYKIIAMKMIHMDEVLAAKHYAVHYGKPFYDELIRYITSAPVIAMIIDGVNAIEGCRKIIGATNPNEADVGTVRADFSLFSGQNTVHGSDSAENAAREMALFFKPEDICDQYQTIEEILLEREYRIEQH